MYGWIRIEAKNLIVGYWIRVGKRNEVLLVVVSLDGLSFHGEVKTP